jgi:hypothetical protein
MDGLSEGRAVDIEPWKRAYAGEDVEEGGLRSRLATEEPPMVASDMRIHEDRAEGVLKSYKGRGP